MRDTKIAWCDHTINLWWGCTQVKDNRGCDHCYAKEWDKRFADGSHWGNTNVRRETITAWKELTAIQNKAAKNDTRETVFVMSMGDLFEPARVTNRNGNTASIRSDFFEAINLGRYPNLIFLLLTKRPERIADCIPGEWMDMCPSNVWFGTSIAEQGNCEKYIGNLIEYTPHEARRFLSIEPLIGPVSFREYSVMEYSVRSDDGVITRDSFSSIDWVIVGGESGRMARPMKAEWALNIKDECKDINIPFFFKQAGVCLAQEWGCSDKKGEILEEIPLLELRARETPVW